MSIKDFIKENKDEIDIHIWRALGDWQQGTTHSRSGATLNNNDRHEWILNDESLYRWAKMYRVNI